MYILLVRLNNLYFSTLSQTFKVNKFNNEDYQTMCRLLKEKYLIHNEQIQTTRQIKLIDEKNKIIGIYNASEARKKALSMKKDIVVVNSTSKIIICKIYTFRMSILQKFYEEIVIKRNQKILSKANSIKQLKVSVTSTEKQLLLKAKQIQQLSRKNLKVRVYLRSKEAQRQQTLQKMDFLKSQLQNQCIFETESQNDLDDENEQKIKGYYQTYSFVVKSRNNEFIQMLNQSAQKQPSLGIAIFLKKYYKQQDLDMKDLNQDSLQIPLELEETLNNKNLVQNESNINKNKQKKINNIQQQQQQQQQQKDKEKKKIKNNKKQKDEQEYSKNKINQEKLIKQAKARILNKRLKAILNTNLIINQLN